MHAPIVPLAMIAALFLPYGSDGAVQAQGAIQAQGADRGGRTAEPFIVHADTAPDGNCRARVDDQAFILPQESAALKQAARTAASMSRQFVVEKPKKAPMACFSLAMDATGGNGPRTVEFNLAADPK